jgi:sec-independent protein translocase protein TatA
MTSIGPMELIVVLAIALLVLGPKRLPDAGRSLGKGLREFKRSVGGDDHEPDALPVAEAHPAERAN